METRKAFLCISTIFLTLYATALWAEEPVSAQPPKQDKSIANRPKPPFTISKETTCLTEPLREDGYVDYVAALNKMCSEGVTPENNAVVPLLQVLGLQVIFDQNREKFFKMLGIEPLPEKGDYLVPFEDFLKQINSDKEEATEPKNSSKTNEQIDMYYKAEEQPWNEGQYPLVAAWLKANQKPLEKIREASNRTRLYAPKVQKSKEPLPTLVDDMIMPLRDCSNLLVIQAMYNIADGKINNAQDDILAYHRLARLAGQGPTALECTISFSIDEMACSGDVALAQSCRLISSDYAHVQEELRKLPPLPKLVQKINQAERFGLLDVLAWYASDEDKVLQKQASQRSLLENIFISLSSTLTDWDAMLRKGNSLYDRIVDTYSKTTFAERMEAYKKIENEIKIDLDPAEINEIEKEIDNVIRNDSKFNLIMTYQKWAKFSIRQHKMGAKITLGSEFRTHVSIDLSQLAFALGAYHYEHGRYPERLKELVPTYIAELPKDQFTNADYIYRPDRKGYILYSVSDNGKDDGGKNAQDDPLCDDIAIRTSKEIHQ